MKQLVFMIFCTGIGTAGTLFVSSFCGIAVYYLFAVLRPQFMWEWSLPAGISWSWYVAATTIGVVLGKRVGLLWPDPALRQGEPGRRLSRGHVAVLLFGLWIAVSYFAAHSMEAAEFVVNEYLKIFVMFAVSALALRSVGQLWTLMLIAAVALSYIAYEVNFQYLVNGYLGIYKRGYGGLDNNGAGLMLAMGVPLCYFAWEGSARRWRWVFLACIPVLIHAVLMTYSRGAMLSLVVASPLIWLRSGHRKFLTLAGVLFVALLLPVLAGPEIQARFFTISEHDRDESAQSRFDSWNAAWLMAQDNPLLGLGPRNSNLFSYQYGADMQGRTIHSQYLQIAADNGLVGMGLYLAALFAVWRGLRRTARGLRGRAEGEARTAACVAGGVEGAMAVFCFGSIFLSLEVFELPYLMLLLGAQLPVVCEPMLAGAAAASPRVAEGGLVRMRASLVR